MLEMPHKTRNDIVAHEEWVAAGKFYHTQRKLLFKQWSIEHNDWQLRLRKFLTEAIGIQEQLKERHDKQLQFDGMRLELYDRVLEWQRQRARKHEEDDSMAAAEVLFYQLQAFS